MKMARSVGGLRGNDFYSISPISTKKRDKELGLALPAIWIEPRALEYQAAAIIEAAEVHKTTTFCAEISPVG